MRETEVKILHINKQEIENCLSRLGAKMTYDGKLLSVFYYFGESALRIRIYENGKKTYMTYKHKISNHKFKDEIEIEFRIFCFNFFRKLLKLLGLKESRVLRKHRTSYILNGTCFDIDKIKGIPCLMEIEGSKKNIVKYVRKLGFSMNDAKPWSTSKMLKYYNHDRKVIL